MLDLNPGTEQNHIESPYNNSLYIQNVSVQRDFCGWTLSLSLSRSLSLSLSLVLKTTSSVVLGELCVSGSLLWSSGAYRDISRHPRSGYRVCHTLGTMEL